MVVTSSSVGSGAAGAATFAGSKSRKYNYYEPRGKRATHYEDVTVDVQPDPERYLNPELIIEIRGRQEGREYSTRRDTRAKSSDWHAISGPPTQE